MLDLKNQDERYMIYGMLFALSNRIQTYGDSQFKEITLKQHFMLTAMELFGEVKPTLKELADLIGCSYQNVKRMAVNLEEKGYLQIEVDAIDKRKLRLMRTDKFEILINEKQESTKVFINSLYKGITKEQLKVTLETLLHMEQNIGGQVTCKVEE